MIDIQFHCHGSIWLIEPLTEVGTAWIDEYLDYSQKWCNQVVCEGRYVNNIVEGMTNDGLSVQGERL